MYHPANVTSPFPSWYRMCRSDFKDVFTSKSGNDIWTASNCYHNTQLQTTLTAVAYGVYIKYLSMFCATNEVQTATHVTLYMRYISISPPATDNATLYMC